MAIPKRGFLLFAPMWLTLTWMFLPFIALVVAPFTLELKNPILVIAYVALNAVAFALGYRYIGINSNTKLTTSRTTLRRPRYLNVFLLVGLILATVLLPPSIFVYTGKSILEISAVLNQGAVYADLADAIEGESKIRMFVSLVRGIVAPITIAVIPLSAFFWPKLTIQHKVAALLVMLTYGIFSAFRGTDKELGDLLILVITGAAARLAFLIRNGHQISRKTVQKTLVIGAILIIAFLIIFVWRKSVRLGGFVSFCLYADAACFEELPDDNSMLSEILRFGLAMVSAYLSQGYYGLSLALPLDWQWTWGIGHSQPLRTIFGLFIDSKQLYESGLMAQLRDVGWDDRYVWSSIFPAIASDTGFAGVPIFLFLTGGLYGKAWSCLTEKASMSAIMTFALLSILVLYIPANHQIAQSFDLYFASMFWISIFIFKRFANVRK